MDVVFLTIFCSLVLLQYKQEIYRNLQGNGNPGNLSSCLQLTLWSHLFPYSHHQLWVPIYMGFLWNSILPSMILQDLGQLPLWNCNVCVPLCSYQFTILQGFNPLFLIREILVQICGLKRFIEAFLFCPWNQKLDCLIHKTRLGIQFYSFFKCFITWNATKNSLTSDHYKVQNESVYCGV